MPLKMIRVDFSEAPRLLRFPIPVSEIGIVTEKSNRFCGVHKNQIEFCIRMNSEDEFAVDTVEKDIFTNRFPHVFVKVDGKEHEYHYRGKREAFFFIYHSSLLPKFAEAGIAFDNICWEIILTPRILELIQTLIALFPKSQERGVADQADILCWNLLLELVLMKKENREVHDPQEEKIRRIASALQLCYKEKWNLDELIRENGLSRRSFFRHWNRFYTKTPSQMILDLKMKEAQHLIASDSLPIAEIAEQLKFSGSAHFIHTFRKYFGVTPLQFRKKRNGLP